MEPLALAIEIADLALVAQEDDRRLDIYEEAKRLVRRYPDAAVSETVVAAALLEEILAADAEAR